MKDTQGEYKLLETIDGPADMKKLKPEELIQLSNELRQYIIEIVSSNHFIQTPSCNSPNRRVGVTGCISVQASALKIF